MSANLSDRPGPGLAKCKSFDDERLSTIWATKQHFISLQRELGLSNRSAALFLLGSKDKESTVRGWTNPRDMSRYPTEAAIEALEAESSSRALAAFARSRTR